MSLGPSMNNSSYIGIVAALGSAASWSIGALLFGRITERLSSFAITFVKGVISIALLAVPSLLLPGGFDVGKSSWLYLTASGVLGIAIADTLFFAALRSLGPRPIVLLSTVGQVFTILLAMALLGERIGLQGGAGIVLIVAGVAAGVHPDASAPRSTSLNGVLLGLASMLCMAASVVLTKKGVASTSTVQATFIRMVAGTAGMLLLGVVTGRFRQWIAPMRSGALIRELLVAVCVITFGGFWLAVVAFKFATVAVASSLISTEPLFILPLSAVFQKERVTSRSAAGAAVATVGVVLLCTSATVQ